jgi:hypothetical protein
MGCEGGSGDLNVCVVFFALFTHAIAPPFAAHCSDTQPTIRSEIENRASVVLPALPATVTVSAFAVINMRWRARLAACAKGEASSKRQGDGQRFNNQKKAMNPTNTKNEASAPANVRPSQSVQQTKALPKLDFRLRQSNRELPQPQLLNLLQTEAPEFRKIAQVVGQWVWVQFRRKQPVAVTSALSQFGFHWNKRRQLWQHPCGVFATRGADYDPRRRYGSHVPQVIS